MLNRPKFIFLCIVVMLLVTAYAYAYARRSCTILPHLIEWHNVLAPSTYRRVVEACTALRPTLVPDDSMAQGRLHTAITSPNHIILKVFHDPQFVSALSRRIGRRVTPARNPPVEYRVYPVGSSMDWHRDDVVVTDGSSCPQYEVVFTVRNTSDSKTEWIDDHTGTIVSLHTKPNSIMVVQARGVRHRVTPSTKGQRDILKLVYVLD